MSDALARVWRERFGVVRPGKIVCVGRNYAAHAEEEGADLPAEPLLFAKFANTVIGDGEEIVLPAASQHVDAEAELALVIGRGGSAIAREHALDHLAGFTVANDVSARDLQFGDGQWFRGKSMDTFCPIGPEIVDAAGFDPADIRVVQRLNGEVLQDSRTSYLIFDIPTLVAYITKSITLERGDLILTGTPEGVGVFREPKITMKPGDVVEVEIEGIGVLRNDVRTA
jgi:2-keto-4-pentenoate hydratase/2-oxohepta-3-ene-1,7-dioic acid hydratase in catechol pathway